MGNPKKKVARQDRMGGREREARRQPDRLRQGRRLGESAITGRVRLGGRNLPCAGGGYFRLLPYRLFRMGLRRLNRGEQRPGIFYFHPWEIDPGQPRIHGAGRIARFRHYLNLAAMPGRLDALLHDFAWDRIDAVFADLITPAPAPARPREPAAA